MSKEKKITGSKRKSSIDIDSGMSNLNIEESASFSPPLSQDGDLTTPPSSKKMKTLESRSVSPFSLDGEGKEDISLGQKIRDFVDRDIVLTRDCSFLSSLIEEWWNNEGSKYSYQQLESSRPESAGAPEDRRANIDRSKRLLKRNILKGIRQEEEGFEDKVRLTDCFRDIGTDNCNIVGVVLTGLFKIENPDLALVVHEALCDLFRLEDQKFSYEKHKKLYVRAEALGDEKSEDVKEWGKGVGKISWHADDLYESEEYTGLLALTTGVDRTDGGKGTPTRFCTTKTLLSGLDDEEIERLSKMRVEFKSGMNVKITQQYVDDAVGNQSANIARDGDGKYFKYIERSPLEVSYKTAKKQVVTGVKMSFDFRDDNIYGTRMRPRLRSDMTLLKNIGDKINKEGVSIKSVPKTGTFAIANNNRLLHSRDILILSEDQREVVRKENLSDPELPRYLLRSKGPKGKVRSPELYPMITSRSPKGNSGSSI